VYYRSRSIPPTVFRPVAAALTPWHAAWPESAADAHALHVTLASRFAAHRRLLADVCYGTNVKNHTNTNTKNERSPTHPLPPVLRPVPSVPPVSG
jgi:hypothetical protein